LLELNNTNLVKPPTMTALLIGLIVFFGFGLTVLGMKRLLI
jgi:hypothetical protein